jgi:hypothetical protein
MLWKRVGFMKKPANFARFNIIDPARSYIGKNMTHSFGLPMPVAVKQ